MSNSSSYRVSNNTTFVKQYHSSQISNLWKNSTYMDVSSSVPVITTSGDIDKNVYIRGNLYLDGVFVNASDIYLKSNIRTITEAETDKLMNLKPSQFTLNNDPAGNIHYGFIAQQLEEIYPELVHVKPDAHRANLKSVNYLEIIPLLVSKIQGMQKEIDALKVKLDMS